CPATASDAPCCHFTGPAAPRHLRSFPTRRSSDLPRPINAKLLNLLQLTTVQQLRLERSFSLLNLMNKLEAEAAETIAEAEAEARSEEHTSELQSRMEIVCRLLLEKKKIIILYNK